VSSENGAVRSYYGQPVIKEPVWTWQIPFYFFTGGLGGASAALAYLAELRGNGKLARRAWGGALAGLGISPALLISDLGRPARFLNMFRMFKVTSPMSSGSWLLGAGGLATGIATVNAWTGLFPRSSRVARPAAALLGLPISTYTAALLTNTSIPIWHESRGRLAPVFAAGAATSAGALALAATPASHAAPARRLAVGGAVAEIAGILVMERHLGEVGRPYHEGGPGTLARAGKASTILGAATVAAGGAKSRAAALAGAGLLAAGGLCERWAVFKAGFKSASDPKYTVGPQRQRVDEGWTGGASRKTPAMG
jgi:Polysulphide reductase, NrfD